MFKGITLEEFRVYFTCEDVCRQYLFDLKWKNGYCCKRCSFNKYWKGKTSFHARCRRCDYDESITAHTVFHKLQIPILKAFSMVFNIVVLKKGISTNDMAEIYGIDKKTAWRFRRKVQISMASSLLGDDRDQVCENYKIDSITISHRPQHLNGLQRVNLMIKKRRSASLRLHLQRAVGSIQNLDAIDNCHLVAGRYVDEGKNIQIWNFKVWLTGVHHHCSEKYIQGYLDEYFFKYNFRSKRKSILHRIIGQMILTKPSNLNVRAA